MPAQQARTSPRRSAPTPGRRNGTGGAAGHGRTARTRRAAEDGRVAPDYRALFEAAPGMLLVLDPELVIVAVSDAYLRATMTDREAILGRGLFEVFPDNPDDPGATGVQNLAASLDRVRSSLVADTMAVQKYDIRRPDEEGGGFEIRYWSPVNTPVLSPDGSLSYIVHRVEDVTEFVRLRKLGTEQLRITEDLRSRTAEMEAEVYSRAQEISRSNRELHRANADLQRARAFLDSLFEHLPDTVVVKEARGLRYVRVNRAAEELLGQARADVVGKDDHDLRPSHEAEEVVRADREVLAGRRVADVEEEPVDTPHRGRRILHTTRIPILGEDGEPEYLLSISEDVTERRQAEDEVLQARNEAQRANQAKTEFLSRVSHELRTPLNAILGFSQLLEMDELAPDQHESVNHILRAGRHLLGLIDEILDISRIESGQLTISLEPVPVGELLDEVLALMAPLAAERDISTAAPEACDVHVLADRQRLQQVLVNLFSNAIKYNRQGGSISVACRRAAGGAIRLSVTDTGYGIAPESLARVFAPFDRIGAEFDAVQGTGIGLAVSEGLVHAMGGTIGVESALDVGSTFWVELPEAEGPLERYAREGGGLEPGGPRAVGRLILQIEDNVSNVRLVERVVAQHVGFDLVTALRGAEGVALARERLPDLVLLDLHLPDMPGHEVLRQLRSMPETSSIPVVVLSADATRAQRTRMAEAGAFAFLAKPLDVEEFLRTIERATEHLG